MTTKRTSPSVAIIGSGFGGIGLGVLLKEAGIDNFTIYEQADDIGGVWRENTYPGAECDVPSPLYSFSFAAHDAWPKRYSGQADIHAYIKKTAEGRGVMPHVQLGTEITRMEYDEQRRQWVLTAAGGLTFTADVVVPAVGQLSKPAYPKVPGMESFAGPTMHSALWDHDVDLRGKRVAVIGTGASAIQFVPRLQPVVGRLTLFQRTPPYILPKPEREYRNWHRAMFRHAPVTQTAGRFGIWATGEAMTAGITTSSTLAATMKKICLTHLRLRVRHPGLRAKLTPDYDVGCKRILFSNNYYPALTRPNVDVVTDGISSITEDAIVTADGERHEVDVIVYGTGFRANDFLIPIKVHGRDGVDLDEVWSEGARAYLGMAVPRFPNLFLMYGPNTNLGGGSIIYMLERQARYIVQAVAGLGQGAALEVRQDIEDSFDAEMQDRLAGSAWAGCASWYKHPSGRITTNWPGLVTEYDRRTKRFDARVYHLSTVDQRVIAEASPSVVGS
jgi:cation diffusion facilitator CzcD-associated flavoprotein CzcO